MTPVGTDKPKITSYVPDWVKRKILAQAELSDRSESKEIEAILVKALDPNTVMVSVKEASRKMLLEWAEEDIRTLETQMQWIVEKAIAEHLEEKNK